MTARRASASWSRIRSVDLAAATTELAARDDRVSRARAATRSIARAARSAKNSAHRIAAEGSVKLEAPIARPPEFLAIGLNYADHVEETGMKRPEFPMFFNKQSSCVTGPCDPIHLPRVSSALDYEGELGIRDRTAMPPCAARSRARGNRGLS